jgi:hypothetical protein
LDSFPSLAYLDADGKKLTDKVDRDLFSMRTVANAALSHSVLKPKVEAGEKVDANDWFMARLGMGELDLDEAKEAIATLELTDAQKQSAEAQILVLELTKVLQNRRTGLDEKADAVYECYKAGRQLPEGSSLADAWDQLLIRAADKKGDAKAFHSVYPKVKKLMEEQLKQAREGLVGYKGNEQMEQYFNRMISSTEAGQKKLAARALELK